MLMFMVKNLMEFGDFEHLGGAFLFVISLRLLLRLPHDLGGVLD